MKNLGGNIANILMAPIAQSESERKKAAALSKWEEQQAAFFEEQNETREYRELVDTLYSTVMTLQSRVSSLENELAILKTEINGKQENLAGPLNYTPLM